MKPQVITVANPKVLDLPGVQKEILVWSDNASFVSHLAASMDQGRAALILGSTKEDDVEGLAVVFLPDVFDDYPWVVHFHNRGGRELTKHMVASVLDFVQKSGYTGYKALNQSGHPDKVWLRIFQDGGQPSHLGSAYFFDLKEVDNGRRSKRAVRRKQAKVAVKVKPASNGRKLVKPARASVKPKRAS